MLLLSAYRKFWKNFLNMSCQILHTLLIKRYSRKNYCELSPFEELQTCHAFTRMYANRICCQPMKSLHPKCSQLAKWFSLEFQGKNIVTVTISLQNFSVRLWSSLHLSWKIGKTKRNRRVKNTGARIHDPLPLSIKVVFVSSKNCAFVLFLGVGFNVFAVQGLFSFLARLMTSTMSELIRQQNCKMACKGDPCNMNYPGKPFRAKSRRAKRIHDA